MLGTMDETMRALADPTRREILRALRAGDLSAGDIAARFDMNNLTPPGGTELSNWEAAGAINYYLNGHGNKLTVDVTYVDGDDLGSIPDLYAGYNFVTPDNSALMIRFQWQLAL